MSNFRLVLRSGPTPGKSYPLEKVEAFIGRDVGNDITINDPEVSRRHARVFMQGANVVLEDLGSTNGTSVNGQRLFGPYVLHPGEIITFGEHISLVFEVAMDPGATVAAVRPVAVPEYTPPPQPPQPVRQPPVQQPVVQQPVYQAPPPPPPVVYAGQVPVAPPQAPPEKKKTSPLVIILIIFLLLILCGCLVGVGYYLWTAPVSFWCQIPILNTTVFTCP
jgi:hypothetical protein